MICFVRKFSNKTTLIRAAALAAAGSGLFCFTTSTDHNASVAVSMPLPFRDALERPWRTVDGRGLFPSFMHSNHPQFGLLPLSFSRPDVAPDHSTNKGAAGDADPDVAPDHSTSKGAAGDADPDVAPGHRTSKGAAGDAGDNLKHSCNCFGRDTIANAAAKIGPAVVNLSVPEGFKGIYTGKNIGSGTIIDEDGTILTCAHAVIDVKGLTSSKGKVEVTLQDGRSFEGTVVNADVHADIAVVKITSKTPLPTAKLGSSSNLRPGDWVVAVGCPLTLQNTVTAGIVSCVDRKSSDLGLGGMHREYLQTDCAINPGNSGGPLVNVDGEVIGVNIMKVSGADGLNFAVPVDSVSRIIEHFKRNGRVVRPWLGLKMIDLNNTIVAHLKETNTSFPDVRRGVLIPMVSPGSPADRAGFRPGDVLVEFGGKPVESIKEVVDIMSDKIGQPFKAVVKRANNGTETLTVTPEEVNPDM